MQVIRNQHWNSTDGKVSEFKKRQSIRGIVHGLKILTERYRYTQHLTLEYLLLTRILVS